MHKLISAFTALRYGSCLADPAVRKNNQNLINALVGLLGALVVFLPIEVTSEQVISIAGGVAALIGLYNVYTTTATTTKIGLPARPDTGSEARDAGCGDECNGKPEPVPEPESTIRDDADVFGTGYRG